MHKPLTSTACMSIYTDEFGDCSGCVRALNFCYRPGVDNDNDTLLTVEIRNRAGNVYSTVSRCHSAFNYGCP